MSNTRYHSLPDAGKNGKCQGGAQTFFLGIYKTKRYIDTLGVHSWEPPGTSRYAQHQR